MSLSFDGSNDLAERTIAYGNGFPLSFSAWVYPTGGKTADHCAVCFCDAAPGGAKWASLELSGTISGDPVSMYVNGSSSSGRAVTSTSWTENAWQHICGTTSSTSRSVWLNGGSKGTDTTSLGNIASTNRAVLGLIRFVGITFNVFGGQMRNVTVWSGYSLTDQDAADLAAGKPGYRVGPQDAWGRPLSVLAHWNCDGLTPVVTDWGPAGWDLTLNGPVYSSNEPAPLNYAGHPGTDAQALEYAAAVWAAGTREEDPSGSHLTPSTLLERYEQAVWTFETRQETGQGQPLSRRWGGVPGMGGGGFRPGRSW